MLVAAVVVITLVGCGAPSSGPDVTGGATPSSAPSPSPSPTPEGGYLDAVTGDIAVTCSPGADGHISAYSTVTGAVVAEQSVNFASATYPSEFGPAAWVPQSFAGPYYCLSYEWDASLSRIIGTATIDGTEVPAVLDIGGARPVLEPLESPETDESFSSLRPRLLDVAFDREGAVWWLVEEGDAAGTLVLRADDGREFRWTDGRPDDGMMMSGGMVIAVGTDAVAVAATAPGSPQYVTAYWALPDMRLVEAELPFARITHAGQYLYEIDIYDLVPPTDYRIGEGIRAADGRVAFLAAAPGSSSPGIFVAAEGGGEPSRVTPTVPLGEGLLFLGPSPSAR